MRERLLVIVLAVLADHKQADAEGEKVICVRVVLLPKDDFHVVVGVTH